MEKKREDGSKKMAKSEFEETLIENFVNLQRVLTNLAVKFDALSDNITKLLQLFEIAAKSFVEKLPEPEVKEKDKEMLNKIDALLEQNKTLARGLTLMEEKLRERVYGSLASESTSEEKPRFPRL